MNADAPSAGPSVQPPAGRRAVLAARVWQVLETVMDPELPMLSVVDLGMIRRVEAEGDGSIRIGVSPTYSGCPALRVIPGAIRAALQAKGFAQVEFYHVLDPPWTSDWITERGRALLHECGIAPPERVAGTHRTNERIAWTGNGRSAATREEGARGRSESAGGVACPRCGSTRTERLSEFGSTPCKAQFRCLACLEPFEHFKCI